MAAADVTATVFPEIIVFDLDYTLWPFWVDTHVTPPFSKNKSGTVVDQCGKKISFYPEVPKILNMLHEKGVKIGVASRTSEVEGANQLLHLFNWNKFVTYKEIYPGSKTNHFKKIHKNSNVEFSKMLFFDDEHRNIRDLKQLGVLSILVENGMTMQVLNDGLKQFELRESKSN